MTSQRLVQELQNQGLHITNSLNTLEEETVELVFNLYREQNTPVATVFPPAEEVADTASEPSQPAQDIVFEGEGGIMSLSDEFSPNAADLTAERESSETEAKENAESISNDTDGEENAESGSDDTDGGESDESGSTDIGVAASGRVVVVSLGRKKRKQIRKLQKGRGRMMKKIPRLIEDLQSAHSFSQNTDRLIVVVEERRRRRV